MVVQNSMLHSLSSVDVQSVSDRFPELRHRLVDHAEDYQRVQAAAAAAADIENLSAIKAKKVTTGRTAVAEHQDPLAIVKAQLSQQEAKLEQISAQQDAKLEQMSGVPNVETAPAAFLAALRLGSRVRAQESALVADVSCRVPQRNYKASWTCSRARSRESVDDGVAIAAHCATWGESRELAP